MAGLKFGSFSQAARVSNLDIDADLDMGTRSVIAAKGRFTDIEQMDESGINITGNDINITGNDINITGSARFKDPVVALYTVTPSDNVYFTANISQRVAGSGSIAGSIVIGPSTAPISPRLYVDFTKEDGAGWGQLRVHKNGEVIATSNQINGSTTVAIDLEGLNGGDVLTFTAQTQYFGAGYIFSNFRLAGDVVRYLFDGPTAETVYD